MIKLTLLNDQNGYDIIAEYIHRYWENNITNDVVVSLATSYDDKKYILRNEIASPRNVEDIEYLYDWWEGEKFIILLGIRDINTLVINDGIYEE